MLNSATPKNRERGRTRYRSRFTYLLCKTKSEKLHSMGVAWQKTGMHSLELTNRGSFGT